MLAAIIEFFAVENKESLRVAFAHHTTLEKI